MPFLGAPSIHHALIRTHHITSRTKVRALRKAASKQECYVLLCSGGCPGIMYCKGSSDGVRNWVATVKDLRYKDYQLISKPSAMQNDVDQNPAREDGAASFNEVGSVKEFASCMEERGLLAWWKKRMGYDVDKV